MEFLDADSGDDDLIDRFTINLTVPVNSTVEQMEYVGGSCILSHF